MPADNIVLQNLAAYTVTPMPMIFDDEALDELEIDKGRWSAIRDVARRARGIDVFPLVAREVMQLVADPEYEIRELERVISTDQALVAKLLHAANSPLLGQASKVESLMRAMVALGAERIREVVMSAAIVGMYGGTDEASVALWQHAVGCAVASRLIALELADISTEESFTCGLLHDVGKAGFVRIGPARHRVLTKELPPGVGTALQMEEALYGCDHTELGAAMAQNWQLPRRVQLVVRSHHGWAYGRTVDPQDPWIVAVVDLANRFCHRLGIGCSPDPSADVAGCDANAVLQLDLSAQKIGEYEETLKTEFFALRSAFM